MTWILSSALFATGKPSQVRFDRLRVVLGLRVDGVARLAHGARLTMFVIVWPRKSEYFEGLPVRSHGYVKRLPT